MLKLTEISSERQMERWMEKMVSLMLMCHTEPSPKRWMVEKLQKVLFQVLEVVQEWWKNRAVFLLLFLLLMCSPTSTHLQINSLWIQSDPTSASSLSSYLTWRYLWSQSCSVSRATMVTEFLLFSTRRPWLWSESSSTDPALWLMTCMGRIML